ncbi:MAG: diguanylate cyclase [Angustibacter sp.]
MRSVRSRLAVVLALVTLLPGVIALVAIGWLSPRQEDRAAAQLMRQVAGSVASSLQSQCLALGEAARLLATRADVRVNDSDVAAAAASAVDRQPGAFALLVRDGEAIARSGPVPALPPAQLADVSCSRNGLLAGPSAALVLSEWVPAVGRDGEPLGQAVVGRVLDSRALAVLSADLGLPEGAEVALACPGGPQVVTAAGGLGERLAARAAGRPGASTDGRYQVDVRPLSEGRACGVATAVEGGRMGGRIGVLLIIVLLWLLLGFVLVLWLASSLTRPVLALTEAAERVARGDLSTRLPRARNDELGRLSASFNEMSDELEQTISELRSSRDLLRENVARLGDALERTHDLDGLLRTVISAALSATAAHRGSAWLVEGGSVVVRAHEPKVGPRPAVRRVAIGANLAGEVAADGVPRRLDTGVEDGTTVLDGAALAAPLRRGHQAVGVLVVEREPTQPPFGAEDEAMLVSLAGPAGIAVDNVLLHREAQKMSVTDPLTGAGNLRHMTTTLAREVERSSRFSRPLSLLLLDLDHFKQVNDTFGHTVGDGVLREIARRLASCVREVDVVCRYGGEEFVVVAPETGTDGAEHLAERICAAVRDEPFIVGSDRVDVTVSVGIASLPTHGTASGDLVRAADDGLYEAKRAGRDRWRVATPSADASTSDRAADDAGSGGGSGAVFEGSAAVSAAGDGPAGEAAADR